MNLRLKILIILSSIGSLFLISLYFISTTVLLSGFSDIEENQNHKNVERFHELINEEQENLTTMSVGWSTWDDSFNFVQKPDPIFKKKNYQIETMFDSKFSKIIYFNLQGQELLFQSYNFLDRKFLDTSNEFINDFKQNIILKMSPGELKRPRTGFYRFNDKIEFFSLNPILPNSGLGNYNGYLLFFRPLDKQAIQKFQRIMKYDLNLTYRLGEIKTETSFIKSKTNTTAEMNFKDYLNRGNVVFTMPMARRIYLHGEDTLTRYFGILLFIILISALVAFQMFDKYILRRILKLNSELTKISKNNSELTRVESLGDDELGKLANEINATLDSLDQKQLIINRTSKFSALGEVAASIAHEINNPLAVIAGYNTKIYKQIESGDLNAEDISRKSLKIKENIKRIVQIIESLRFISRDGDGDDFVKIKIGYILDDVQSLCKETLKHKTIRLNLEEFNYDHVVTCRPVQIAQVLVNLINNSIDALEQSHDSWISITSKIEDNKIIVSVTDSGPIIPDSVAQKILDPFFTTKASGKGTGLGLSISKAIMESHDGILSFETSPHTCFRLEFPTHLKLGSRRENF